MAQASSLQYTPLSVRAQKVADNFMPSEQQIAEAVAKYSHVLPRGADKDGDTEVLDGVSFTHRIVLGPGDGEVIQWHYVETGPASAEIVVFLHGIPDSWYQWHHQMAALSQTHRCIAVDLKGYGQSSKAPGDYRHEGAGEQLFRMLQQVGAHRFNLVTHDRGTVQGDFLVANHPDNILRYARGEQHLYHFNPRLAPQGDIFMDAPYTGVMENPIQFVMWVYTFVAGKKPLPESEMERTIQEFSYPGITKAVPRYFNSSSFRQEWLQRRERLLAAWKCPVLILQGKESKSQPHEFYENVQDYIPNSPSVSVEFIPGGHFWTMEAPSETIDALRRFLAS